LLFNRSPQQRNVTVAWRSLAVLGGEWKGMTQGAVRDLWAAKAVGYVQYELTLPVEAHAVRMLRVSAVG